MCDRCAYRQEASAFSLNPLSDRIPRHLGIIAQSEERAHPEGLVPGAVSQRIGEEEERALNIAHQLADGKCIACGCGTIRLHTGLGGV